MSKSTPTIQVTRLSKRFDTNQALTNLSFEIPAGKIVALIGPNGSGKTTLIKILTGLHAPSKGTAKICGYDITTQPLQAKRMFGYVPDNPSGFEYLTGNEFLKMTGNLKEVAKKNWQPTILELAQAFTVDTLLDQRIQTYSRGNRQKLAFLAALIGPPKLLLIDEPIVGLDPHSIAVFGETLREFSKQGGTVLFSTHILEFGKQFAKHVLLIHQGKLKLNQAITSKSSLAKYYQKNTSFE